MNPHDPFHQPQGGSQPYGGSPNLGPLDPSQPSIQPQVSSDPLYDQAPAGNYGNQSAQQGPQFTPPGVQPVGQHLGGAAVQSVAQVPTIYQLPPKPSKLWLIISIISIVLLFAAVGAFVWAILQYMDQRDNVDSKVSAAVSAAMKTQADKDAAAFLEKEKEPNRLFVGPDDYGRLAFNYPKTWSTYVDKDAASGGAYAAYLNPVVVPPVAPSTQQFALRVLIEEKDYDAVVNSYREKVKKGELKSSAVKADDQNGTRLDGNFTKDIKGHAVIFKIRDKTVTVKTDAEVFGADFDAIIKTITFNK